MEHELDIRKLRVLAAIVETFIQTGEPVGSKLVAELLGGEFSPATVRNDMATLFEMGLLEQPHTSAGRVPSHLGYRTYIDRMMKYKPLTKGERDEIEAMFNLQDPDPDRLLADAAQVLADKTKYATISTTFKPRSNKVKRIELIPAGGHTVVILLITTTGVVKSRVCRVSFQVTPEVIDFFSRFSNGRFAGMEIADITAFYVNSLSMSLGEYTAYFNQLLSAIYDLCREAGEGQYYSGGASNLLTYAEFSQIARELFGLLDRRETVQSLISRDQGGVQITIGRENSQMELLGSSVIISQYKIGESGAGAIGIIGPVRMDYARMVPRLEYFAATLGRLLSETFEET